MLMLSNVKLWLSEWGVNAEESEHLFEFLDDGDGTVSHEEVVRVISKPEGEARVGQGLQRYSSTMLIIAAVVR